MTHFQTGKIPLVFVLLFCLLTGCQHAEQINVSTAQATAEAPAPQPAAPPANQSEVKENQAGTDTTAAQSNAKMGMITAVRMVDFNAGWLGGEGWIARTEDSGKSWTTQFQMEGTVTQLFALNGQDAWATVTKDTSASHPTSLLSTNDGGSHWSMIGEVPNQGFLHFITKEKGFSGNARTIDGGKTWTSLPVPVNAVGDAYFHDDDHGWAVVKEKDTVSVVLTNNGGKSWKSVMERKTIASVNATVIRSVGTNDAWIECIGDSGMTQTSYSLFHTIDGGQNWRTVIAKTTAGGGPAPGFPMDYTGGPTIGGSSPGPFYVVNSKVAFFGAQCMACDKPNSIGWTMDGGKTVVSGKQSFAGYGKPLIAFADAKHGWWICTDNTEPAVMYTTLDGGQHWSKVHTYDTPGA